MAGSVMSTLTPVPLTMNTMVWFDSPSSLSVESSKMIWTFWKMLMVLLSCMMSWTVSLTSGVIWGAIQ